MLRQASGPQNHLHMLRRCSALSKATRLKRCCQSLPPTRPFFREFLNHQTKHTFRKYQFDEMIKDHVSIATEITNRVKPLAYFDEYLQHGYYPYYLDRRSYFSDDLLKHINLALEIDVTYLNQIELKYFQNFENFYTW
jgi:hypothetical protein